MNILGDSDSFSDSEPQATGTTGVQSSKDSFAGDSADDPCFQGLHSRVSDATGGVPVIGTIEQWASLPIFDRETVALLDKRVQSNTSLDNIRNYFSTGCGANFPTWVRESFLGRVPNSSECALQLFAATEPPKIAKPADADEHPKDIDDPFSSERRINPRATSRSRRSHTRSSASLPAPTLILRSAVFRGVKGKNKKLKQYTRISALKGINLEGKGRMPSALDLITWLGAVKLARAKKTTGVVKIYLRSLLEATDRPDGTRSRQLLKKSIKRIAKFKIRLNATWGGKHTEYAGPLLCHFAMSGAKSGKKNACEFSLSAELLAIFDAGETYLKLNEFEALRQRPLCIWLWAFYSGHDKPYTMLVTTIKAHAGFKGPTYEFRRLLSEGLDFLKAQNLIESWLPDKTNDKVTVIHKRSGNALA
jgi:hypothetical protein